MSAERDDLNISLDTLPFWPWLWADPFHESERRGNTESMRAMAEKRLRVNYETARAPIPNQYALVHRADIQTLMHEVWRLRALAGLLPAAQAARDEAQAALAVVRESLQDQAAARADPKMPRLTPEVLERLMGDAEAAYALAETREERVAAHGLSLLCDWQAAGDLP